MNLEIGDFVDFDAILGGVKPYGIDYHLQLGEDGNKVNKQSVFKNFLIISTNKTLEFCEIECIQMHNLNGLCDYDCNMECNGDAVEDECGVCNASYGGNQPDFPYGNCDCLGVSGGSAVNIGCGCGVVIGDEGCTQDCTGVLNGTTEIDECGVCGGSGIPNGECDCNGNILDNCGLCGGDASVCCNIYESMNYVAGTTSGVDCLTPSIVNYLCSNDATENYICDNPNFDQYCDGDALGSPEDGYGVWVADSPDSSTWDWDGIQSYCSQYPENCIQLSNLYPIVLTETGNSCTELDIGWSIIQTSLIRYTEDLVVEYQYPIQQGSLIEFNAADGYDPFNGNHTVVRVTIASDSSDSTPAELNINIVWKVEYQDNTGTMQTQGTLLTDIDMSISPTGQVTGSNGVVIWNTQASGLITIDTSPDSWSELGWLDLLNGTENFPAALDAESPINIICEMVITNTTENITVYDNIITFPFIAFSTFTCPSLGDLSGDGGFNVLDVVSLANCVLAGDCGQYNCGIYEGEDSSNINCSQYNICPGNPADLTTDGGSNVLDIVTLANCVLAGDCG